MHDPNTEADYLAYLDETRKQFALSAQRRGKAAPMKWGKPIEDPTGQQRPGYFCEPCWRDGTDGFHPHSIPPCDPFPTVGHTGRY